MIPSQPKDLLLYLSLLINVVLVIYFIRKKFFRKCVFEEFLSSDTRYNNISSEDPYLTNTPNDMRGTGEIQRIGRLYERRNGGYEYNVTPTTEFR